ncbi:alpha/beta fold hydrolase [Candidatus Gracilibacteria bacterium]|nr:alpha/beta fold hydrolase [Candidatus Gracilibacteria bacterium]
MDKNQILMIGGGEAFENTEQYLKFLEDYPYDLREKYKSWKGWLLTGLSDDFEGIRVEMPATQNSYYAAWKIWFEKYFQYLGDKKIIIIGHSLGGIFLAKYLSENNFPKPIHSIHLISPVFDNSGLKGESTASFSFDPKNLENIINQSNNIHIWHSKDDTVVPFEHSMKFHTYLNGSILHTFDNRGHFSGQSHFVELFLEIQKVL